MVRVATLRRVRWWWLAFKRVIRSALKIALICAALFILSAIIFWDVDFYPARNRWEIFKLTMFGDWPREGASQLPEDQMFVCEWQESKTLGTCVLTPIDAETKQENSNGS